MSARAIARRAWTCALLAGLLPQPFHAEPDPEAPAIRLRSAVVRGPDDTAGLPEVLLAKPGSLAEGGPALIRLRGTVDAEARNAAAAVAGIRLAAYLGDGAYVAYLPPNGLEATRDLPGLAWAAPYHPGLRIAPILAAITADDPREQLALTLHLEAHARADTVAARLEALGFDVRGVSRGRPRTPGQRRSERPGRIVLLGTPADWVRHQATLAGWPETLWIDRRPTYRLFNDDSAWVGQSGLHAGGTTPVFVNGIFGDGQVVGVMDTGLDADMCYFRDDAVGLPEAQSGLGVGNPDPTHRKVLIVNFLYDAESPTDPTDWDTHDHGTHVAGSVAGDDLSTPGLRDAGDGMAPAAKLVIQDGGYGVDDCADMPAIGCPAADLYPFFEQAYLQGARIHTNSYGDRENFTPYNIYTEGSEAADAMMWDHPEFLIAFSAGNNGSDPDTVASPATGKNVLAVGATYHGGSADWLATFSSRGPTHDGRIKPDVTAPGVDIVSADNDGDVETANCGTRTMSGTSMSGPTAAGLAALVREYYDKGYYPSGVGVARDERTPSAALLKATLIASAAPMAEVGEPPPSGPQGWGRLLLDDALYFPGDVSRLWVHDTADRFSSSGDPPDSFTVEVLDDNRPLRVVLAWTDYPSNPMASVNLVNDLDLEVISPSETLYRGNVFADGASVGGGSADRLNNVEGVRIESPEPGTWTVRVSAEAIPQPAQGYALVVTGRVPVAGVMLERVSLSLDDAVGGNGDGALDPGEWIDLPLTLLNSGDALATGVTVLLESLSAGLEVVRPGVTLSDISPGAQAATSDPNLRIRLSPAFACNDELSLRFNYYAEGFSRSDDLILSSGAKQPIHTDDFEGPSSWQHVAGESTASTGDWIIGDPVGTGYQPGDDATPPPGTDCLYTAPNAGGGAGAADVDGGVVVARSGAWDLAGHPEAHLSLQRWFGNRDRGEDIEDYYRLEIRHDAGSDDVLLEELDFNRSEPRWTEVTFRVADFVATGAGVELKVSASDGSDEGNIIEAAIDEIVFWEPACEVYDPVPNPVNDLTVDLDGEDVLLFWGRPEIDPAHGEASRYRIYRSTTAPGGFAPLDEINEASTSVSYRDAGAVTGPPLYFYKVVSGNDAGDSAPPP